MTSLSDQTVLYVEDDAHSRKLMSMLLVGRMHLNNVSIFEDSSDFEAKVMALNPRPTIIFLDIHVTPLDGFQMLELLRQMPAFNDVPIIALTASVMNEEVHKLRGAGFNGCIAKPLDLTTFPDTFQRLLNGEAIWRIV